MLDTGPKFYSVQAPPQSVILTLRVVMLKFYVKSF